jgi:polyhydroxybutyrate depolymerase
MTWTVGGVEREALVFAPATAPKSGGSPLVFAFHGHGGTMRAVARRWRFDTAWPDAIVVYPQGLPSAGARDPEGKRPGWQRIPGELEDRDVKFFDAALAGLRKEYAVDDNRIYVVGFSNGGAFTYLLWDQRPETFAAVAPCGSLPKAEHKFATPKPVIIVSGEKDPRVTIDRQREAIERIRKVNGATADGKPAGGGRTIYESEAGMPVETFLHAGAHLLPPRAPKLIVEFFKQHELKKLK